MPLRWAAANGQLSTVKFLLDQGADIHAIDDMAFLLACQNGHFLVAKLLVSRGANIHARNNSALREAVKKKNYDLIAFLLDMGASVDGLTPSGLFITAPMDVSKLYPIVHGRDIMLLMPRAKRKMCEAFAGMMKESMGKDLGGLVLNYM